MQCACWRGAQGRTCGKKWWMFLKAIWALSLSFSSSFALSTLHVGFSIHPHQALGFFFYNTLYASLSHFFPRLHNPSGTIYLLRPCYVCVCVFGRFRAGFKQAFRWCPCIHSDSYEGLELKSTRYLQTQTSVYKTSRAEPTVLVVNSPSLELASNGSSSRSMSKTVSETSSFYCGHNLPA